jgi:hypothetical protein
MTPEAFRRLALNLPETIESAHMGHPDFRVAGRIFATLGPGEAWGMVKLTRQQQKAFVLAQPKVFEPINGAWGRGGCTKIILKAATKTTLTPALVAAWRNTAPADLSDDL